MYNNYNFDLKDSDASQGTDWESIVKEVFGFSAKGYWDFFLPKEDSMQDQIFDITIENLNFVSLPTITNPELNLIVKQKKQNKSIDSYSVIMFNVVLVLNATDEHSFNMKLHESWIKDLTNFCSAY